MRRDQKRLHGVAFGTEAGYASEPCHDHEASTKGVYEMSTSSDSRPRRPSTADNEDQRVVVLVGAGASYGHTANGERPALGSGLGHALAQA